MLGDEFESESADVAAQRRLEVRFATAPAFRLEFERNLSKGGLFVPTADPFDERELVEITLVLDFCDRRFDLPAEVVDRRPPELEVMGAPAGVAVQILRPASELRRELGRFADLAPPSSSTIPTPIPGSERRRSAREPARVGVAVATDGEITTGKTHDLSTTGAFLTLADESARVGDEVRVTLVHPVRGDAIEVAATVVRATKTGAGESAVAVEFEPAGSDRSNIAAFVEDVQAADHARRLAAIEGAIDGLGVANLIQMLGACARQGTVVLTCQGASGRVVFEGGVLQGARLGDASGTKALARMLAWKDGRFEFHNAIDAEFAEDAPQALDAALFEAMRQLDELARASLAALPPTTCFDLDVARLDAAAPSLAKTEQAVIELVQAGFTLGRLLDVIPEPDSDVLAAIANLRERRIVTPR